MTSPTQPKLTMAEIAAAARSAFGRQATVRAAQPLTGGGFAAVWRVDLEDGRQSVLKVGPEPAVRLLTYEADLMAAEAEYLRLVEQRVPETPTPRLLHQGDGWLFMTLLPGIALPSLPAGADVARARFECGVSIGRLHTVTGDRFGYSGNRPHGQTWRVAFTRMVEALLDDAATWQVTLPVEPDRIRAAVSAHDDALDTVTQATLVHFDLWDGNVLATPDGRFSGLVDGERYLFGDALLDFASAALFRDILDEPEHPWLRGYRSVRPLAIDNAVRRRAWLCQLYLYLLMTVEFPSRGMTMATHGQRWVRQEQLLHNLLSKLDV